MLTPHLIWRTDEQFAQFSLNSYRHKIRGLGVRLSRCSLAAAGLLLSAVQAGEQSTADGVA